MSKAEEIPDIGLVHFRRMKRAKRISIHVKPFHGVFVTLPYRVSLDDARHVVAKHKTWIMKKKAETRAAESAVSLDLSEGKVIVTRRHVMRAVACDAEAASWTLKDGALTIFYPRETSLSDSVAQAAVRTGLVAAYRTEAKLLLPPRVNYWAERFGLTVSGVVIKNMRSRWGSCSARNVINLNLHLMRLNDSLIDYVILHELAHTRVKNHGAGYWRFLQSLVVNSRELDEQLRKQSIAFF
ncbi:MAG TPA: SprT family zinc-dependent metalloprotease [Bacteroidota bacterium]|nr:SprT family zinc-dependent metalloprotease [Bacteroidota bacterium]